MINRDNIIDLWDLYTEYLENYKANYRDENYLLFEEYVENYVKCCDQCGEYYDVNDDYLRFIDGADQYICEQCLTNGWGQ